MFIRYTYLIITRRARQELPLAALTTHELIANGILSSTSSTFSPDGNSRKNPIWDITTIADQMHTRLNNGGGVGVN